MRTHPFQIAYWNVLAGGTAGAYSSGLPQAGDYWGMSYRLGLEWLNDNAPPDSALAVPVVEHAVRLVATELESATVAWGIGVDIHGTAVSDLGGLGAWRTVVITTDAERVRIRSEVTELNIEHDILTTGDHDDLVAFNPCAGG